MATQPKTTQIPFGQFQPDQGENAHSGLISATNIIPQAEGYTPPGEHKNRSVVFGGLPGGAGEPVIGGIACAGGEYLYQIYVAIGSTGGAGELWEINSLDTSTWGADELKGVMTFGESGVHFAQFGTHLFAACGADWNNSFTRPQWLGPTNAGAYTYGDAMNLNPNRMWPTAGTFPDAAKAFVDAIETAKSGYVYKARFCAALDRRMLIAHLYDEGTSGYSGGSTTAEYLPYRIAWSQTNDPRLYFDPSLEPESLSDYEDLYDDWGPITGLSQGGDYTLVFKARGIYRMDYGGPFQYSFQPIPQSLGTRWSHSIIRVGNDVYFWGPNGPAVYLAGEHRVQELSLGRISRSLRDTSWIDSGLTAWSPDNTDEWLIKGAVDSSNGLVLWTYPTSASATYATQMLVYNYAVDRFSVLDIELENVSAEKFEGAYPISIPDSADDYAIPRDIAFCRFETTDQENQIWQFKTGGTTDYSLQNPTVLETAYFRLQDGARTMITRVRPIISVNENETTIPVITLSIDSRDDYYSAPTTTTATTATMDRMGWIATEDCPGREFHKVEFSIAVTDRDHLAEIEGFEIEYRVMGVR